MAAELPPRRPGVRGLVVLALAAFVAAVRAQATPPGAAAGACGTTGASCSEAQVAAAEEELAAEMRVELLQRSRPVLLARAAPAASTAPALPLGAAGGAGAAAEAEEGPNRQGRSVLEALLDALPAIGAPDVPLPGRHRPASLAQPGLGGGAGPSRMELEQVGIPLGALAFGVVLMLLGLRILGILAVYFGAQSGFSLYMKVVLSNATVSQELHLKGVPAAFLVTAIQQVVAFALLLLGIALSWCTRCRYRPRALTSLREFAGVLMFSLAFALNIGLNNFSLSLMAVSLNLIIRSCLPLVTLALQVVVFRLTADRSGAQPPRVRGVEVLMMGIGVLCAGLATYAKSEGSHSSSDSEYLLLGVAICALSDLAAALNLVLANMWAPKDKPTGGFSLNPLDTTLYMAVPAALFLSPAAFFVPHPIEWKLNGHRQATDWQVLQVVAELSNYSMGLVLLSGVLAAAYNLLQYAVVQSLSATHAAFAGNFNKAATIMLSICLGLEQLPGGRWSGLMVLAVIGNILSFTGYSLVKASEHAGGHPDKAAAAAAKPVGDIGSDLAGKDQCRHEDELRPVPPGGEVGDAKLPTPGAAAREAGAPPGGCLSAVCRGTEQRCAAS